jgi:TPR repeat protein
MKILFRGLFALLFSASVAGAQTLEVALQAWRGGDRAAAMATWHTLAARGDAEASLFLGYVYRNGLGVKRDAARAAEWYRRAARLGQPEAQYELALMYELGIGVTQDPAEAALWYGLSSAQACPSELTAGGRLGDR